MSEPGETRQVNLEAIREPELPIRAAMDDDKLDSLVGSIRELGIIEPLILAEFPDHYEVKCGHRRLRAAQRLNLPAVPARIWPADHPALEAFKVHENTEREELSPAEEAIFYGELLEKFHYTEEQMCQVVHRSADYIGNRLKLLRGDIRVLTALLERQISLGVAEEINRIVSEVDRDYYLHYAISSGVSVSVVREWRQKANLKPATSSGGQANAGPGETPKLPTSVESSARPTFAPFARAHELLHGTAVVECRFCPVKDQEWKMYKIRLCSECALKIFGPGGPSPEP